jgi:cobyrinic acid a,c-diamide synthase
LHAARLAANRSLWDALAAHVAAGKPALAECGGMMALFETLVDLAGAEHRLAGLLPGRVAMQKKLAALGMQQATFEHGATIRGHTFHYSRAETPLAPLLRATKKAGGEGEPVYRAGRLTASYLHLYFPSNPAAVAGLFGDR